MIVLLGILMAIAFPTHAEKDESNDEDAGMFYLPSEYLPPDQPVMIQIRARQIEAYACQGQHFEFVIYKHGELGHSVGHTYYRINNWVGTPVPGMVAAGPGRDFAPPTSPRRAASFTNRLFFEGGRQIKLRVPMYANESGSDELKYFFVQVYTHEPSVLIDPGENIAVGVIAPCKYMPQ